MHNHEAEHGGTDCIGGGGKPTGILHLLNQSSQTLSVCIHTLFPYGIRGLQCCYPQSSGVLLSMENKPTPATPAPSWQTGKNLRECGSGSCALSVQAWRDSFYCQVSLSPALEMKSKRENKNTAYSPLQNRVEWKKTNFKQTFSNDNFLLPNALKGKDYIPNLLSLWEQEQLNKENKIIRRVL